MQIEVKRVAVVQTGRVFAVLYTFVGLITLPFLLIGISVGPQRAAGAIPMLVMVMLYPLFGFIGGIILAALYNLAAKWVGGIRFTMEQWE